MGNLIVITGPTAVGKTELCIRLAHELNAPIVNADSRQVFREMKIGTARPCEQQLACADFYFVGCISVYDYYSAARYESDALETIAKLHEAGENVILSGGSMMYVDAVVNGIDDIPTVPDDVRAEMRQRLENEGLHTLCEELKRLDPEYYSVVDLKNPRRVVHALEICKTSGKTYTSFRTRSVKPRPFRTVKIGLNIPRSQLFERINKRVDNMIANGLVDEAWRLYPLRNLTALNTVGYNEMFKYFDGEFTLIQAVERIKKNTRVYAKKQLTWYKRDDDITWFDPNDEEGILKFIDKQIHGKS